MNFPRAASGFFPAAGLRFFLRRAFFAVVPAAFAGAVRAVRRDLEMLGNELKPVLFGDRSAVPVHERRVEFDDFFAVVADDVSLERSRVARAFVILEIAPDVQLADDSAGDQRGKRAINRRARDGRIAFPRREKQLFRRKVPGRLVCRAPDRSPLLRVAETVRGEQPREIRKVRRGTCGRFGAGGIHKRK